MKTRSSSRLRQRQELPALADRLRQRSRKITGPRKAILEMLRKRLHPMTNKEIFAAMPEGRCDLATVYRAMRLLEAIGMVKQFDFGDGIARFELIHEGEDSHHHHLVCTRCAEIVEIEECALEKLEKNIAAKNGFADITHKLEFFGLCPDCQGRE